MDVRFPSRQGLFSNSTVHDALGLSPPDSGLNQNDAILVSTFVGIDAEPRPMDQAELDGLGDAFTKRFLSKGVVPLTLRDLLDGIDGLDGDEALPDRRVFLVAEGGRHRLGNPEFPLNARLVFSWSPAFSRPVMFLSTVPSLDDPTALLQLVAWSEVDTTFHFFERRQGRWTWAGNSMTAFDDRARGKGPCDSHINGGLVMKELKAPWAHWHSQSSSIPFELLEGTDFGKHPGMSAIDGAELLENLVKAGVRHWTRSRIAKRTQNDRISLPRELAQHLTHATSANLVGATISYPPPQGEALTLPVSFFLDVDTFRAVDKRLGVATPILPTKAVAVSPEDYVGAIGELEIGVVAANGTRVPGDTTFCFVVPERAFEDVTVVDLMLREELLSARLALCILLVDFSNPVRSAQREALLRHFPEAPVELSAAALDAPFLASVQANAGAAIESEFLSYWNDPDIVGRARSELAAVVCAVSQLASTSQGVVEIVRLAEARRNLFRKRKLNEFSSTTARAADDVGFWRMTKSGEIVPGDNFS